MLTQSEIDAIIEGVLKKQKIVRYEAYFKKAMRSAIDECLTEERQRAAILMDALVRIYNENSGLEELCRQAINTYNKNKPNDKERKTETN